MGSQGQALLPMHELFGSGQLFYLPSDRPVGLLIVLPHYVDFAGCGAVVGGSFDLRCVSVYPIGDFQFAIPETTLERQKAFQRRLAYLHTLHRITFIQPPLQRACLIIRQLCQWITPEEAQKIPLELIAKLIGVLPRTIEAGWQYHLRHPHLSNSPALIETLNSNRMTGSQAVRTELLKHNQSIASQSSVKVGIAPGCS